MTVEYVREKKELTVFEEDGSYVRYKHVESPAADALFAAPSIEAHVRKYICNIYQSVRSENV